MFSISKAFRVLSLVLAAVLVPATAFAGTPGFTAAKPGQAQTHGARGGSLKLKKASPSKANKAVKAKAHKAKAHKAGKAAHPKLVLKQKH